MTQKELKARYKQTILGFLWILINPLFQMIVIGTIFTVIIKEPVKYYFHYLFLNLLLWNFFSLSVSRSTGSIVGERDLIKKAPFSRSVIPVSIILANSIQLFIALVLYTIFVLFIRIPNLLLIPVSVIAFLLLFVFTLGLSLLTAALNVKFRDVNFLVQSILMLWFYATPIVYDLKIVPKTMIWLWFLNPLTLVLQTFQHSFLDFSSPDINLVLSNLSIIIFTFIIGCYVFYRQSKHFDDYL